MKTKPKQHWMLRNQELILNVTPNQTTPQIRWIWSSISVTITHIIRIRKVNVSQPVIWFSKRLRNMLGFKNVWIKYQKFKLDSKKTTKTMEDSTHQQSMLCKKL